MKPELEPTAGRVAVLIPCFNEEQTVGGVVGDFRRALPGAEIFVFDNASTDATSTVAAKSGATVVASPVPGKGNAVRHMFRVVEADWYLMVDGDSTYPATSAPEMLRLAAEQHLDMLVGRRRTPAAQLRAAYRPLHQTGNRLVCRLIGAVFGSPIQDVFSGYRVFSRNFVKSVPLHSGGFQIEVEMTLQALSKGYAVGETDVIYGARPEGSKSKLSTYKDGILVLAAFAAICRDYRPGLFFGCCAVVLGCASVAAGVPPVVDFYLYQYVYHVPLAVLATGLAILAALALCVALILETQLRYHNELHALLRRPR